MTRTNLIEISFHKNAPQVLENRTLPIDRELINNSIKTRQLIDEMKRKLKKYLN